jgi:ABC-2 family transporter
MLEGLGPYRAALRLGRRRSLIVLLGIALALLGTLAWTSYRDLNSQRKFLKDLQHGTFATSALFRFGVACFGGGGPQGPPGSPIAPQGPESCQFIGPGGQPIGPSFKGDPFNEGGLSKEQITKIRPQLIEAQRQVIRADERILRARTVFSSRVRSLGTLLGVVFIVILGSTFMGAEYRFGVWRTLLTHEPRRARVLIGKFIALWTLVLIAFVSTLFVMSVVDAVMRVVSHVHASGGASIARLVGKAGFALLVLELFATIAATFALAARVSLAGLLTLVMILGDHLLIGKYHFLRHYSPVQQVATLVPRLTTIGTGYAWPPRLVGGVVCQPSSVTGPGGGTFGTCREIMLKPIPHWRASVVLSAWLIGFVLLAWSALRARDVPQ